MSSKKALDVLNIITRLKKHLDLKKDTDLAFFLEVKQNTISAWKRRGNIDFSLIVSKCEGIDLNWLMYGEEKPVEKTDPETLKINQMLKGMSKEEKIDVLKYIEKEKLWKELMEEREDKKKGA